MECCQETTPTENDLLHWGCSDQAKGACYGRRNSLSCDLADGGENMTEPAKSQNDVSLDTTIPGGSLESSLCTQELRNRPSRSPDYEKENRALVALANALADSPGTILQTLTDKVFDLLHSDSAGLSLLTKDENR